MGKKIKAKPEVLGHLKARVIQVDAKNPYFDPAKEKNVHGNAETIRVHINMMESPAAIWYHRNLIGEPEYLAASKFRTIYERAQGTGAGAFDYTKEKVDTSGITDPIDDRKAEAHKELAAISRVLGTAGYLEIRDVCGLCIPLTELAPRRVDRDRLSQNVRMMLPWLAEYWGYRSREIRAG